MNIQLRQGIHIFICTALLLTFVFSSLTVLADDDLSPEQRAATLQYELDELDQDLLALAEQIALAEQRVAITREAISRSTEDLYNARACKEEQLEAMHVRIRFMYEIGNASLIEVLFSAGSMSEFLNTAEFIQTVNHADRMMLTELQETYNQIAKHQERLELEEVALSIALNDQVAKRTELEEKAAILATDLEAFLNKLEAIAAANVGAFDASNAIFAPVIDLDFCSMEITYEARLLAAIIHTEARGEPLIGQIAVGNVVMNRMRHGNFPDSIEAVIRQPGQFCPVREGSFDATLTNGMYNHNLDAALAVLSGVMVIDSSMLFFNSLGFGTLQIGNHWFRPHY